MPIIKKMSGSISPFTIYSDGSIQIKFKWFEKRLDRKLVNRCYNIFAGEIKRRTSIKLPDKRY